LIRKGELCFKVMNIGQVTGLSKINNTETEILLAHLLSKDRSFIKAFSEYELNKKQMLKFSEFIERRSRHEPVAYILGYKEFFGLKLKMDERSMIPRHDTEDLVNEVIKYTKSLKAKEIKIVDVGTGSGNIAISLAIAIPNAKIYAVEKDKDALTLAKENIATYKLDKRIKLFQGDLLTPLKDKIDIIVANLPYVPSSKIKDLQPEISKWEPRTALDGGTDGMKLYRKLFKQTKNLLKPGGILFCEIDGKVFTKNFN